VRLLFEPGEPVETLGQVAKEFLFGLDLILDGLDPLRRDTRRRT
jgi:hypothetical protein